VTGTITSHVPAPADGHGHGRADEHAHGHAHSDLAHVAAWVDGHPITVGQVELRLAALRTGPLASRLPPADTPQGRNLRRWLVQVLTVEQLIAREAAVRALVVEPRDGLSAPVTLAEALRAGGVSAAVLAVSPLARALRRDVVADVAVPEEQVRGYYERNRDRHLGPYAEERVAIERHLLEAARERAFGRWLDRRYAEAVRLEPGFEHPADPRQPDADHRH
jgi:[acyl-carrier-protein] S-malonyltransferase